MTKNNFIFILLLVIILSVGLSMVSAADFNNQTGTENNSILTNNNNQQSTVETPNTKIISTTNNNNIINNKVDNNQNTISNANDNQQNTKTNTNTKIKTTNPTNNTNIVKINNKSDTVNSNQQNTTANTNMKISTVKTATKNSLKTSSDVNSYDVLNKTIENAPSDNTNTVIDLTGDFDGTGWIIVSAGKNITINGHNHVISAGDNKGNFLWIENQGSVILNNVTISKYYGETDGGAITNYGNLTIINSTISNSISGNGTIKNIGNLNITGNNTFINNSGIATKASQGGVIYNEGNVTINGTNVFKDNNLCPGDGGVIDNNKGIIYIIGNNTFTNNNATEYIPSDDPTKNILSRGGVLCNNEGIVYIIGNNTFANNNATNRLIYSNTVISIESTGGGALYNNVGNIYIIGNNTFKNNTASHGGVIMNWYGFINVTGTNTFTHSNAADGGAITIYYGNLNVTGNNTFTYNNATQRGGAIYSLGFCNLNVTGNNTFSYNNASLDGGAINNNDHNKEYGNLSVTGNNTFTYNYADFGGAIINYGFFNLTGNNTLSYNNAKSGGAIFGNNKNMTIIGNNTFSHNNASTGGALYSRENLIIIGNNTFTYNNATNYGGVIVNTGTLNVTGTNTFTYNNATNYGGVIINFKSTNLNVTGNNIFSYNKATNGSVLWSKGTSYINGNTFTYNNATDSGVFYLNGTTKINGSMLKDNVASVNGGLIYNIASLTLGNSTAINNYVTNDYGFVIYNINSGMEVINNTFLNNTVDNRDMLINSTVSDINVNSNYYSNNMLNTTITPIADDNSVTGDYTTPVTISLRSVYNDTVRNGTITVYINSTKYTTLNVENGKVDTLNIPLSRLYRNSNVALNYTSLDKDYQNATTSFTLITTKNDTITNAIVLHSTVSNVTITANVTDLIDKLVDDGSVDVYVDNNAIPLGTYKLVDGKISITLSGLSVGEHNISINYTGTNQYSISNTTLKVNVEKIPTSITVNPTDNINYNDNETINGILIDEQGKIIPNTEVILTVNGVYTTVTTNNQGEFTYTLPATTVGVNSVVARYNGNEIYGSSVSIATFNVNKINTNITANITNNTVVVNITDINGNPVDNGTVLVYENNTLIGTFNITQGTGNITLPELPTGEHNLTLNYTGTNKYNSSNTTVAINIENNPSTITVDPIVYGMVEDHVLLNATITDKNGNPINGGIIVFKINGETLKYTDGTPIYVNVTNGKAQLDYIIPKSWIKPNMTIGAAYSGTEIYTGSRAIKKEINIVRRDALVDVTTSELSIKATNTTTFTAVVTDKIRNQLVQAGIVIFKFQGHTLKDENGTTYYANITNGVAQINYTAPIGISSHNYTVTAVYANLDYNRAENITKQFVNKTNIEITASATSINKVGDNLTITGTIKDILGNNVIGTNKIAIKINGVTVKDANNNTQFYYIKNGNLNLTINNTLSQNVKNISIVTGERYAYFSTRTITNNITTIKTAKQSIKVKV